MGANLKKVIVANLIHLKKKICPTRRIQKAFLKILFPNATSIILGLSLLCLITVDQNEAKR